MSDSYRATRLIHRGIQDSVQPGEIMPATYQGSDGTEAPYDFESLLESGAVELVSAPQARKRAVKPAKS